jgi:hypothetical protein
LYDRKQAVLESKIAPQTTRAATVAVAFEAARLWARNDAIEDATAQVQPTLCDPGDGGGAAAGIQSTAAVDNIVRNLVRLAAKAHIHWLRDSLLKLAAGKNPCASTTCTQMTGP